MSNTKASKDNTFTPVFDRVLKDTSLLTAAIFGRVWRFCQMEDGVCSASQARIAEGLGIGRTAVNKHIKLLVNLGYLMDLDPGRRNHPHRYEDTGKAGVSVTGSTLELLEVSPGAHSGVTERTTAVRPANTKKRQEKRNLVVAPSQEHEQQTPAVGEHVMYFGTEEPATCPQCHTGMVVVKARRSDNKKFLGCSRYGEGCRWTGDILTKIMRPPKTVVFEDGGISI